MKKLFCIKTKVEESTRLAYTGVVRGTGTPKDKDEVNDERLASVMGKRELKIRRIYECRCDERLQTKTKEITLLTYTGLVVELEHLKIEKRCIDEKFANTMGEYVT
jgi:hypothetical protein